MHLLTDFAKLIGRDIKAEGELKDSIVLVRLVCIIDMIATLIQSIVMGLHYPLLYCIAAGICFFGFLLVIIASYDFKPHSVMLGYFLVLSADSVYYTLCVGIVPMYQCSLLILILLFFFRTNESLTWRIICVVMTGGLALFSSMYVEMKGPYLIIDRREEFGLLIANMLIMLVKITLVAAYFQVKFSSSEKKILMYAKKLEKMATLDPLTRLQNRRGMLTHLDHLVERYAKSETPFTIAIADIDFFKKVNDTYGHEAGDYVLTAIASIFTEFMNKKGRVSRWGGEEFLFSFENTNGDYAFEQISKLKSAISRYDFCYNGTHLNITMTFGVEEYDNRVGIAPTIQKADEKLYMGKEQGRNRVIY